MGQEYLNSTRLFFHNAAFESIEGCEERQIRCLVLTKKGSLYTAWCIKHHNNVFYSFDYSMVKQINDVVAFAEISAKLYLIADNFN